MERLAGAAGPGDGEVAVVAEAAEADVIRGIDRKTGDGTIFFDTSLLKLNAAGLEGPRGLQCRVFQVTLDFDTDEPEQLAGAVLVVKGSCDAAPGAKPPGGGLAE